MAKSVRLNAELRSGILQNALVAIRAKYTTEVITEAVLYKKQVIADVEKRLVPIVAAAIEHDCLQYLHTDTYGTYITKGVFISNKDVSLGIYPSFWWDTYNYGGDFVKAFEVKLKLVYQPMLEANARIRAEEQQKIDTKERELRSLIRGVNTTAQLEEQWEDAASYYPAELLDRRNV
jgi:hypothetical protein